MDTKQEIIRWYFRDFVTIRKMARDFHTKGIVIRSLGNEVLIGVGVYH